MAWLQKALFVVSFRGRMLLYGSIAEMETGGGITG